MKLEHLRFTGECEHQRIVRLEVLPDEKREESGKGMVGFECQAMHAAMGIGGKKRARSERIAVPPGEGEDATTDAQAGQGHDQRLRVWSGHDSS